MEVLAPDVLPGVGMGDIASIAGIGGLVGLAVTSGALLAAGLPGALVYVIAAAVVLGTSADPWRDQPVVAGVVLGAVLVLSAIRSFGAPRWAVPAAYGGAVLAGLAVGFAWAQWEEGAFSGVDGEALVAVGAGMAFALLGGWAADLFVSGSVRAGATLAIVGVAVAAVALALNAASFYIPFVGFVVAALAVLFAVRLRKRERAKYKGLRILS